MDYKIFIAQPGKVCKHFCDGDLVENGKGWIAITESRRPRCRGMVDIAGLKPQDIVLCNFTFYVEV